MVVVVTALFVGLSTAFSLWNGLFLLLVLALCGWCRCAGVAVFAFGVGVVLVPEIPQPVTVSGGVYEGSVVLETAVVDGRTGAVAGVKGRDGRYRLLLPSGVDLGPGDVLSLRAEIVPVAAGRRLPRFERALLRPVGRPTVHRRASPHWSWGLWMRRSFTAFIDLSVDPRVRGIVQALCFNHTAEVGQDTMRLLRRSGTIHIVSTSGLHVVIVAVFVLASLSALPVPRGLQLVLLVGLLLVYAAAAGFRPPVVRSVTMIVVALAAYLFRRERDGLSALAVAGLAALLWSPEALGEPGLQLSFVTVAGLLLFGPPGPAATTAPIARRLVESGRLLVATSLVASFAAAPLVALHFGEVSLVSPFSNLLVVPFLAFTVVSALVAWGVSFVSLPVGVGLVKSTAEPMAKWIDWAVSVTGSPDWAAFAPPPPSTAWLALYYGSFLLLWRARVRGARERLVLTDW